MISPAHRLFLFLFTIIVFAAEAQPTGELRKYMESVRNGGYDPVPKNVLESKQPNQILQALVAYERDSVIRVRSRAYNIAKRLGTASRDASVRAIAVDQLVRGVADKDGGISGNCSEGLTGFSPTDFSDKNKATLQTYLLPSQPHLDQVILLVGYLQIDAAKSRLSGLLAQTKDTKIQWSVRLALARMGDQASISYITSRLANARVNDDFIYEIVPDLIYTRSPKVFEFLEDILMSDAPDCRSADPDRNDKILCGYRVLEYIAYAIEDFPVPVDQYQEAEIDDYEQTLLDVRDWFDLHPDYDLVSGVY